LTAINVGDYVALYAMKSSHGGFFAAKVIWSQVAFPLVTLVAAVCMEFNIVTWE